MDPLNVVPGDGGSLRELVAGRRSGGAVCRGCLVGNVVTSELSAVLACKSEELVAFASLWDLDAVLVCPLLDL